MKLIKKIVNVLVRIILIIILFVLVNLLIWCIKIGSFSDYISWLNDKSWNESVWNLTRNPVSRVWLFQIDSVNNNLDLDTENMELIEKIDVLLSWETIWNENIEIEWENTINDGNSNVWINSDTQDETNPYDPDFEDEFNSFFVWN